MTDALTTVSAQAAADAAAPQPGLVRAVSRWQIVGLAINDVIGSGVYLLPAGAALLLGPASIWAVILAGITVTLLVLCFAEAASYFEGTGGGYLYTREAFGEFVGFEVGWMTWLARIASVAALTAGFAQAVSFVWPPAAAGLPRAGVVTLLIGSLAWINVIGVKQGARLAAGLAVAKVAPLVLFAGAGLFAVDWSRVAVVELPPLDNLGEAALLLLFAYAGFENTAAPAGEYQNPKRNVPFALVTMIVIVTVLYALVQLVTVGTLPGLAHSESAVAESAALVLGTWAGMMMTIAAMVSIGGNAGNTTLIGPRYLFALAEDGFGPRVLARVHPRYRTPAAAILVQSGIALVLALSGSFVWLAMLSIIARLATYVGTAAAIPVLRRRFGDAPGAWRMPGGLAIPVAALLLCVVFLASTTLANLAAGAAALGIGAILYFARRRS